MKIEELRKIHKDNCDDDGFIKDEAIWDILAEKSAELEFPIYAIDYGELIALYNDSYVNVGYDYIIYRTIHSNPEALMLVVDAPEIISEDEFLVALNDRLDKTMVRVDQLIKIKNNIQKSK